MYIVGPGLHLALICCVVVMKGRPWGKEAFYIRGKRILGHELAGLIERALN